MIITCPNCNKQFKIDNSLIPDEGRDLQCGSCDHIWFYNIQEKNNEELELKQEIISEDIETKVENKEDEIQDKQQPEEIIKTEINNKKKEKHTYGRSGRIRTCDPLVPNQMRYQAALHSDPSTNTVDIDNFNV